MFSSLGEEYAERRHFRKHRMAPGAASSTEGIYERLYFMRNDSEAIVNCYLQLVNVREVVAEVRCPNASFLINMCNSVCTHVSSVITEQQTIDRVY